MTTPLSVLMVEDVEDDAELLLRELRLNGYAPVFVRVETEAAFAATLVERPWQLVLSDFSLPSFNATTALAMLQKSGLDIPFIIVSGTAGEEATVAAMRAGAHDYLRKDQLMRLGPAIDRELREAQSRAERRKVAAAQKETQNQLLISERMASVGLIAAGVAHEINNPLASVIANLDFALGTVSELLKTNPALEELGQVLRDAREAGTRVRGIVQDLKVFSRSEEAEGPAPVDVRRVIESALRMSWNEIRHRARLVKELDEVPLVLANEARLGQVLINLIINAVQAIPEGQADQNEIRVTTKLKDGRVRVELKDTGAGMTPEVRARLFTPFFTTKPVGVGTGIGLSICHRLITELGGTIEVDSEVGKGTTFRLVLPIAAGQAVPVAVPGSPAVKPARRGKILVVDDEQLVATAIERTLRKDHDAVCVTSGARAMEKLTAGERFDLIICDLMMPHMSGMEVHARLTALDADQASRMIFLSGGAFTDEAKAFLEAVLNLRVDKPFNGQALRDLVSSEISRVTPSEPK